MTISTQPEALRLADLLADWAKDYATTDFDCDMGDQAAAELRRLHQSEREGWRYADELERDRKRLEKERAEALKACKLFIKAVSQAQFDECVRVARAAIAKAEGTA